MKIEKINDNQIKCTLTRSDLASRQLKLSELAYGTEKAKGLFQDMMDQANLEFGFDAADLPLMIEAIPVSMDCIILMITKVENPDEVDTRFSTLSSLKELFSGEDSSSCCSDSCGTDHRSEDLSRFAEQIRKHARISQPASERIYSFDNVETVIDFAHRVRDFCLDSSTLFRVPEDGRYYLHIRRSSEAPEGFSAVCCTAVEFGSSVPMVQATYAYMNEHFTKVLEKNAIPDLAYV
ncbi:MAG: adaptor protein MecA [Parasporobacterium sp.]|nr:adaptor protein MecA [Parasporobacterium sp.]